MSIEGEAWNSIVEQVRSLKSKEEQAVQNMWENFFTDGSLFGYSRVFKEMIPQYSLQIGVTKVKADILLRKGSENLFVVELKRFDHSLAEKNEQQLTSYMLCLKLSVGVLICNKIYIYVFSGGKTERLEIPFVKDDLNGANFISLLKKGNFSPDKVMEFVVAANERKARIAEIEDVLQKLDVAALIKEYLMKQYAEDEIGEAMRKRGYPVSASEEKPAPAVNKKAASGPVFHYGGSLKAKGILTDEGFVLLKGSEIKAGLQNSAPGYTVQDREKYANMIVDGVTAEDILFSSSSAAANFVGGSSLSGNRMWRTDKDEAPKDFKKSRE